MIIIIKLLKRYFCFVNIFASDRDI